MSDPAPPAIAPDASAATLPPSLRLLKWLVILLTLSMIGGVITVVWLIVTRMPATFAPQTPALPPALPAAVALPEGRKAAAVTFGQGWFAVVTTDDHILIFGADGKLRQEITISPTPGP